MYNLLCYEVATFGSWAPKEGEADSFYFRFGRTLKLIRNVPYLDTGGTNGTVAVAGAVQCVLT